MRSAESDQSATSPRINYVIAPERSVGGVSAPTPGPDKSPEKKSRKGLVIGWTSGLAGAAVAAAAIIGVSSAGEAPQAQPTAEAPADPSPTVTEAAGKSELLPSELDLEIPAGLSAEEAGSVVIDRYNSWYNAGANNQSVIDDWFAYEGESGDFAMARAEEYAATFADALYVSDWQSRPDMVNNYQAAVEINAYDLELNLITNNPDNGDIEPFRATDSVDAVREIASGDGTRTLEIDCTLSNNKDLNRAGQLAQDGAEITVPYWTRTVTLVTIDGSERIAATSVASRQQ